MDPEGPVELHWSADPGVTFAGATLPLADADQDALGTTYTATVQFSTEGGQKHRPYRGRQPWQQDCAPRQLTVADNR